MRGLEIVGCLVIVPMLLVAIVFLVGAGQIIVPVIVTKPFGWVIIPFAIWFVALCILLASRGQG